MTAAIAAAAAVTLTLLSACTAAGAAKFPPEEFGSTTTHSRNYDAAPAHACEAARRALLSQGFVIFAADADHVNGRKNFQPEPQTHVELEFHAVCAPDGDGGRKSIAFVNALQDRYALKKSSNSASVGVGPIGSLSLPFSSSDDALVKVSSETITDAPFYDRFFTLLRRYLEADSDRLDTKADDATRIAPVEPKAHAGAASGAS